MRQQRQSINQAGMTLIEVIIALSVIVTGVISGLTLTSFNLTSAFASETRLIAANLAREGIEAMRMLRDSNWLANNSWNQGMVNAGQYRLTVNFDEADNLWTAVTQTVDIDNCADCQLYLDEASGVYSHDDQDIPVSYRRLITLKEICWQEILSEEVILAAGGQCSDFAQDLIGYEVESLVKWQEVGREHELSVIDRLYDWR